MKKRKFTTTVIIHHSLSKDVSVNTIREWHLKRGFDDIGYHYVIREDGKLEAGRDLQLIGAHARGRNSDSIGVCLTGNFRKKPPTAYQIFTLKNLIDYLNNIYGFSDNEQLWLDFHRGTVNQCPGKFFPSL